MKDKLLRVLKLAPYPLFYVFCLVLFGYITFPFDRMKDRILSEIGKQSKGKGAPVITMDALDSYWLTGAEVEGLKIRLPADDSSAAGANKGFGMGYGMGASKPEPEKDSVIVVKEAHARARLLPLIIGRVQLDFWANVFGGEVTGSAPVGSSKGDVALKLEDLKLSEVEPLQNLLGVPIDGKVNGELSLSPADGKFSKSSGKVDLSIKSLVVSDGKTKIQGLLAIPPAKIDDFVLTGEVEKGVLKVTKLSANGPDLELEGDGKVTLKEAWGDSVVELYIKFRFTDAYRGKDATTKSLLGEPGSPAPSLIEMQVSQLKKAKRSDGFYGFKVHGKLKKLEFTPSTTGEAGGASNTPAGRKPGKVPDITAPPGFGGKKVGGVSLPLGMSSAMAGKEDRKEEKKEEKRDDKAEERKMAAPTPVPPPAASASASAKVDDEPFVNLPIMQPQYPSPPPGAVPPGGGPPDQPPPGGPDQPPPPPPTQPEEQPR